MSDTSAMAFAFLIAAIMFICFAAPYYQNQTEQKEADIQITSGTVSNMTAETDDISGKIETVYTIYISGSYVYDGEERIGEDNGDSEDEGEDIYSDRETVYLVSVIKAELMRLDEMNV